jgi:hypothetical protein
MFASLVTSCSVFMGVATRNWVTPRMAAEEGAKANAAAFEEQQTDVTTASEENRIVVC